MTDTEIELGIISGPNWTEACGHGGYVASYECSGRWYDLYVFDGQSVCIRYSSIACEYLSFPNLFTLYKVRDQSKVYDLAVRILNIYGRVRWEPNNFIG